MDMELYFFYLKKIMNNELEKNMFILHVKGLVKMEFNHLLYCLITLRDSGALPAAYLHSLPTLPFSFFYWNNFLSRPSRRCTRFNVKYSEQCLLNDFKLKLV